MVKKQITMKALRRELVNERRKAKFSLKRSEIESELRELRISPNRKFLKRLGRGFVVLTKKGAEATGRGIRQARKFAEESGAGRGLDIDFKRPSPKKRRIKSKRRDSLERNDIFSPLDF